MDNTGTVAQRHKAGFDSGSLSSGISDILVLEVAASAFT